MRLRRRVLMQLTPILDLMMTVMFVQAVLLKGVSDTAVKAETKSRIEAKQSSEQAAQWENTLQESREERKRLEEQNAGLAKEREELLKKLESAEQQRQAMLDSKMAAEETAKKAAESMEKIAEIGKEFFNISEESAAQLTHNLNGAQAERIRQQIANTKEMSSSEAITHLIKLDELQKRCDFWELYITASDYLEFSVNEKKLGSLGINQSVDSEHVVNKLVEWVQDMEEPKSLVLIVLARENVSLSTLKTVKEGLSRFKDHQNTQPHSKTRYEIADWGFRPK